MSLVRGGGVGVRSCACSARGLGRRWEWQGRARCRQYRPDVGTAWLGSRAGLWWPLRRQGAAGGVACLGRTQRGSPPGRTGSLLGQPAPSTRRGSRGRAAPGSPSKLPAPTSPRRCARHRVAALAAAVACDASAGAGPSLGASLARRGELGGGRARDEARTCSSPHACSRQRGRRARPSRGGRARVTAPAGGGEPRACSQSTTSSRAKGR